MSQYSEGTVNVTNGSATVVGALTAWSTEVAAGDLFTIIGSGVTYQVASVGSDTSLTLTAPYTGTTETGQSYVLTRDFTPNYHIPLIKKGDVETATLVSKAMAIVDTLAFEGDVGAQGATGLQGPAGSGAQGIQGIQGVQGDLGIQGTTGSGAQGTTGTQGATGAQGVQGLDGNVGPSGIQGFEGAQGTTGAGTQGIQGIQGEGGIQGLAGSGGAPTTAAYLTLGLNGNLDEERVLIAQHSIIGTDGGAGGNFTIGLDGDVSTPGGNYLYGTDNLGTKGWQSAATVVGLFGLDALADVDLGSPILDDVLYFNGVNWVAGPAQGGGASVTVSDTPPVGPINGDLWYDSANATMMVYYNDGEGSPTTSQWVETAPAGIQGIQGITGAGTQGVQGIQGTTGSGAGSFGDGTVGAPSIYFTSDTNTGIYRIGDDEVGVAVGGIVGLQIKKDNVSADTGFSMLSYENAGSATTGGPDLTVYGTDANIPMYIYPKGAGVLYLNTNGGALECVVDSGAGNAYYGAYGTGFVEISSASNVELWCKNSSTYYRTAAFVHSAAATGTWWFEGGSSPEIYNWTGSAYRNINAYGDWSFSGKVYAQNLTLTATDAVIENSVNSQAIIIKAGATDGEANNPTVSVYGSTHATYPGQVRITTAATGKTITFKNNIDGDQFRVGGANVAEVYRSGAWKAVSDADHTHSYLPLAGGALTGATSVTAAGSHITFYESDGPDAADRAILELNGGAFNIYTHDSSADVWYRAISMAVTGGVVEVGSAAVNAAPLKVTSTSGYATFGAENSSWFHMSTDRAAFYMGDPLHVNGSVYRYGTNYAMDSDGFYVDASSSRLRANASTYVPFEFYGSKGGYGGIKESTGGIAWMWDASGNGGNYREASSRWFNYYNITDDCTAFRGTGTSSSYAIYSYGAIYSTGNIVAYSDERKKENITTIDNALDKVLAMRGVYFNRKDDEKKSRQVGVIAQEVNKVVPEVVTHSETHNIDGTSSEEYGVSYGNLVGVLIEAIKEQQKQIDELKRLLQ